MKLPIKFPSDEEVITGDVARFRALSAEDQVRAVGEMFDIYQFLASAAAKPDAVLQLAQYEEARGRQAIEEFIAAHGSKQAG